MPLIELTIGRLTEQQKRQIARGFSRVLVENGQPQEAITLIFRHVTGQDVAVKDGTFPYWPEKEQPEKEP